MVFIALEWVVFTALEDKIKTTVAQATVRFIWAQCNTELIKNQHYWTVELAFL